MSDTVTFRATRTVPIWPLALTMLVVSLALLPCEGLASVGLRLSLALGFVRGVEVLGRQYRVTLGPEGVLEVTGHLTRRRRRWPAWSISRLVLVPDGNAARIDLYEMDEETPIASWHFSSAEAGCVDGACRALEAARGLVREPRPPRRTRWALLASGLVAPPIGMVAALQAEFPGQLANEPLLWRLVALYALLCFQLLVGAMITEWRFARI